MNRSYQIGRRAFLASIGAAAGLRMVLANLEAAAQEVKPPPRFLMMFWPVGTVRYFFLPEGTGQLGDPFTTSRILRPFEDAGLHDDMVVLYGLHMSGIGASCSGGSEGGVVLASTGADIPGTRSNGGEPDDAVAGGPSFDQIFLNRVPDLQRPGQGYANAICDERVDSFETSSRCLSYSYSTRAIEAATADCTSPGGSIVENVPLLPHGSPFDLFTEVFGSFAPEAGQEELLAGLRRRQSVLDHSLRELERLKTLAPSEQWPKIDQHAEIVRKVEQQLAQQLENATLGCELPEAPDPSIAGQSGSQFDYGDPVTDQRDDLVHQQVGALHMSVIRAAFQCDLLRVATFQWSPSTNHVSFYGLYPGMPDANVMHHPMSHRISNPNDVNNSLPSGETGALVEFLANVQTWYNTQTASLLNEFKSTADVYGGNLFDHTIFPFITDTAEATHRRSPAPALIFGGKALGMHGGQYLNFPSVDRSHNDLWMTIAQAYLNSDDPLQFFADDVFYKTDVAPIQGLWSPV
jgi:hypothetical protein